MFLKVWRFFYFFSFTELQLETVSKTTYNIYKNESYIYNHYKNNSLTILLYKKKLLYLQTKTEINAIKKA